MSFYGLFFFKKKGFLVFHFQLIKLFGCHSVCLYTQTCQMHLNENDIPFSLVRNYDFYGNGSFNANDLQYSVLEKELHHPINKQRSRSITALLFATVNYWYTHKTLFTRWSSVLQLRIWIRFLLVPFSVDVDFPLQPHCVLCWTCMFASSRCFPVTPTTWTFTFFFPIIYACLSKLICRTKPTNA